MNKLPVWRKAVAFLIVAVHFLACNPKHNTSTMTPTDSLERARRDSIDNVYRDSVAKAEEARLAYLNRPWKLGAFVDQFGDPTDEKYVRTEVEGVFKNSATSGSNLFVEVLLDKTSAGIFLHEYSRTRPAEKLIGGAQIQMKNSANQKLVINTSGEWNQSGGIRIDNYIGEYVQNYDFSKFKSFIQKSKGQIKVVILDDYSSVYSFSIDATGFTKEFSQL